MSERHWPFGFELILPVVACFLAASCSTTNTVRTASDISAIREHQPFSLNISAASPQMERLLQEYITASFDKLLVIGAPPKGTIEVIFTSHDQANEFSKWQNSTMLMVIKSGDGARLWTGEYTYKGGMELSSFSVNAPAEAAKLVSKRMAAKFESDYLRSGTPSGARHSLPK